MSNGYCKFCRKHDVQVSQYDRFPDNTIIRNERFESQGICWDCELQIKSTKSELLEAHMYLKDTMHMYIAVGEMLNILPDEGTFNLESIYTEINFNRTKMILDTDGYSGFAKYTIEKVGKDEWAKRVYKNLKEHVGVAVVAAARMKQEDTPKGSKQAAKSIFLRGDIDRATKGMGGDLRRLEKEYGKWYWNV